MRESIPTRSAPGSVKRPSATGSSTSPPPPSSAAYLATVSGSWSHELPATYLRYLEHQIRDAFYVATHTAIRSNGRLQIAPVPEGADPPADNVVKGNVITGNQPDIFTDGSGTGNAFFANAWRARAAPRRCRSSAARSTSQPPAAGG